MITIALPNFANPIAWLAMESLKRQITKHDWELIVFEDSDNPLGKEFYNSFDLPCKRITYIYQKERIALNQKWIRMAELSHPDSLGIILQASDCYSEPNRIETAHNAMSNGADWIHSTKGYFYNIRTGKMMLYNHSGDTGLNMAISIKAILSMSMPRDHEQWSSVDNWLYTNLPDGAVNYVDESDNYLNGVDTDGYNRISLARRGLYDNPTKPFEKTSVQLSRLIPEEIIIKLNGV